MECLNRVTRNDPSIVRISVYIQTLMYPVLIATFVLPLVIHPSH